MGAPMAANLARADGVRVRVWNRTRSKAEPLAAQGAEVCDTPAQAVRGADVVLTMLYDGPTVASAMEAASPGLRADAVWLQCTTVGVAGLEPLRELARQWGLTLVDAPVLGTRQPAQQGQLVVLAAGPSGVRGRLEPVLSAIGSRTRWVAEEPGAATRLKLVCNSWVLTVTHGVAEALALARGLEVDPADFLDAVAGGALDMGYLRAKATLLESGDLTPSFAVDTALKDAGLIVGAAQEAGVRLDLAEAGRERFARASQLGYGAEDMAASYHASFDG